MTRMWFSKEGASDHCQMIVERVMGLREDGTEDWDLFIDNLYMFFTGSDIRKFVEMQTAESLIFLFLGFLSANNHTKKHS